MCLLRSQGRAAGGGCAAHPCGQKVNRPRHRLRGLPTCTYGTLLTFMLPQCLGGLPCARRLSSQALAPGQKRLERYTTAVLAQNNCSSVLPITSDPPSPTRPSHKQLKEKKNTVWGISEGISINLSISMIRGYSRPTSGIYRPAGAGGCRSQ